MNIIRVGDPHAKVGNLDEMKGLVLFIAETAKAHMADRIEILGDLLHTHAVIRLEVLLFRNWALEYLGNVCEVVVLVGNHDISGDHNSSGSSLTVFGLIKNTRYPLTIVENPKLIGEFGYVPYNHSIDSFIAAANSLADQGAKILVCHQTIQGSKYESGIYAPDGIPTGSWSERFERIFSGHIHSEQEFGNITYPGTARWDSVVDANRRKGIWVYDHEKGTGKIQSSLFVSTENVCNPIKCFEWKEGDPAPDEWPENAKVAIELIGSSTWVSQQKVKLKGKCSIKTKITDKNTTVTRTAGNSLEHFLNNLFSTKINKKALVDYGKEIGIV